MVDVLNEVTSDDLTREQVQRRVEDWARRITDLYDQVKAWLPSYWTAERKRTKRMHEELMRDVGLPPEELPILDLLRNGRRKATIEPRGLWIVGYNGRLDLTTGSEHFLIIDVADNLAPPQWHLASLADRRHLEKLDKARLLAVL